MKFDPQPYPDVKLSCGNIPGVDSPRGAEFAGQVYENKVEGTWVANMGVNLKRNVVNIESFIEHWQSRHGKKVISRIDIPYSHRQIAMQELRTMGITRASLFPGLDGICGSFADMF